MQKIWVYMCTEPRHCVGSLPERAKCGGQREGVWASAVCRY